MQIRSLVRIYAALMLLISIAMIAYIYYEGAKLAQQASVLAGQQAAKQVEADTSERSYRALETEQQAHRAEYDPRETVMMSYQVQEAKQAYENALAAVREIKPAYEAQRNKREQLLVWMVPLIAWGLLHAILLAMFRHQQDELAKRVSPGKGKAGR